MADVNDVVDKIGWWQVPVLLLIIFRSWPLSFHIVQMSFAAPDKQDHWCARPPQLVHNFSTEQWRSEAVPLDDSGKPSRCLVRKWEIQGDLIEFKNETEKCSSWEFNTTYYDWTVSREFHLVCDKSWQVSGSQALFMAGIMIGNVVFARIADRFGRKKSLLWSSILMLVSGFLTVPCNDFLWFNVARFGTSIACGAYQCTILSLLMESLSARKRSWVMLSSLGWCSGMLLLPLIAYALRDWRHQQLVYAASAIPCLLIWFFLPESPRWLLASGRVDRAEKAIGKVVRKNRVKNVDVGKLMAAHRAATEDATTAATAAAAAAQRVDPSVGAAAVVGGGIRGAASQPSQPTYIHLFRGKNLRTRTICILLMYFANRLLMFHLTFFSARMGGNPFWGFALVSLLSIPAEGSAVLVIRFVKRRWAMVVTFIGAGVFISLLLPFGEDQFMARVVVCTLAKSLNVIGASSLSVFATESFPTVVRAMGIGSAYTTSRVGAMVAPFLKELADYAGHGAATGVSVGVALLGALSALFLPETLNQSLPDTLADVDPQLYSQVSSGTAKGTAVPPAESACDGNATKLEKLETKVKSAS